MALRKFECSKCRKVIETLKKSVPECTCGGTTKELISSPNQKFMVTANASTGTSKIKDSDKILKARARNHSRDVLGDDTIQTNLDMGSKESVARGLLNSQGQRRRKIDDI